MPEVDDERAEVINYGLQVIIGEMPKIFIVIAIALVTGVIKETLICLMAIIPYKMVSGGIHLKTHIGCIISTTAFYVGTVFLSKYLIIEPMIYKYILIVAIWIFNMIMIKLYAPADTENAPILRKSERKIKRILSYIIMTITLIIGVLIKDVVISNILIYGTFIQTLTITRFMYKLAKNKYGYEEYLKSEEKDIIINQAQ